jgi:serine phosphatase RsbU (regulator of sigma subunit)
VLGVFTDVELTQVTVRLDTGDMMVLYTDGVTEARGVDGFYGAGRLTRFLARSPAATAEALADDLLGDVVAFQQGRLRDDVAILVVAAEGAGASQRAPASEERTAPGSRPSGSEAAP